MICLIDMVDKNLFLTHAVNMVETDPSIRFGLRLRRARSLRGLSLRALSDAIGGKVSHAALQKYEKGVMGPDSSVLNLLCEALDLRPEFFFQRKEVELSGIEFRKRSKLSVKAKERAHEEAREFFERYLEIEEVLEIKAPTFKPIDLRDCSLADLPNALEDAAEQLRENWELGRIAIPNVHELLEDNGIKVKNVDAPNSFDGFSGWAGEIPVVVLAEWLSAELPRKRLTATHELGHLYIQFPENLEHKDIESYCYWFGGAFLIPKREFINAFGGERTRISIGELIAIKEEWGISIQAAMRRARNLDLITQSHYVNFSIHARKRGWTKAKGEPGEWIGSESANRFRQLVYQAVSKTLITRSKAAGLLETSLRELDDDLFLV